jgi:hypothetical protein
VPTADLGRARPFGKPIEERSGEKRRGCDGDSGGIRLGRDAAGSGEPGWGRPQDRRPLRRRAPRHGAQRIGLPPTWGDTPVELEGADFLGWKSQSFDTDAGPLDVVPLAAAIGGFEDVATSELALGDLSVRALSIDEVIASKEKLGRPKDTAALPALYATREALRRRKP